MRLMILLLLAACATRPATVPTRAELEQSLLAVHHRGREGHLQTNIDMLQESSGEQMLSASRGRITRFTPADERARFTAYFEGAKYELWDDLEPPVVRVSNDGSMGWILTRIRSKRTKAGKTEEFVYAGIWTYERVGGKWVRVANVSTFEE